MGGQRLTRAATLCTVIGLTNLEGEGVAVVAGGGGGQADGRERKGTRERAET